MKLLFIGFLSLLSLAYSNVDRNSLVGTYVYNSNGGEIIIFEKDGDLYSKLRHWHKVRDLGHEGALEILDNGVLKIYYNDVCSIYLNSIDDGYEYSYCSKSGFDGYLWFGESVKKGSSWFTSLNEPNTNHPEIIDLDRSGAEEVEINRAWKYDNNQNVIENV